MSVDALPGGTLRPGPMSAVFSKGERADLSAAGGYLGQSDMWAFQGMPFFNVTPKLQVVGRYTFIDSDEPNGIRLATYESRVVSGRVSCETKTTVRVCVCWSRSTSAA